MKRIMIFLSILTILVTTSSVFAGPADDRFKGGGSDGYAQLGIIQTTPVIPGIEIDRFRGGSYDGYGIEKADDLSIVFRTGTVLEFR